MTILGILSEFSLPEVLLSIGRRTGRLRLYDVPKFGHMEIDISRGHILRLHANGTVLTEISEIVAELIHVVEAGLGMFEFSTCELKADEKSPPIPIEKLVMLLVVRVDERLTQQRALLGANPSYVLESSPPDIWMEGKLRNFLETSKPFLGEGIRADELAESVGVGKNTVRLNLDNLNQSGYVRLVDQDAPESSDSSTPICTREQTRLRNFVAAFEEKQSAASRGQ